MGLGPGRTAVTSIPFTSHAQELHLLPAHHLLRLQPSLPPGTGWQPARGSGRRRCGAPRGPGARREAEGRGRSLARAALISRAQARPRPYLPGGRRGGARGAAAQGPCPWWGRGPAQPGTGQGQGQGRPAARVRAAHVGAPGRGHVPGLTPSAGGSPGQRAPRCPGSPPAAPARGRGKDEPSPLHKVSPAPARTHLGGGHAPGGRHRASPSLLPSTCCGGPADTAGSALPSAPRPAPDHPLPSRPRSPARRCVARRLGPRVSVYIMCAGTETGGPPLRSPAQRPARPRLSRPPRDAGTAAPAAARPDPEPAAVAVRPL